MKKILLLVMLMLTAISAPAQSKLNPAARIMVNKAKMFPSRGGGAERVAAVVRLAEDADASALEIDGVQLISSLGSYATVSFPLELAEAVAALPQVKAVSFGEKAEVMMDTARVRSYVNKLQQGLKNDFSKNYRGAGILLGMMDQGLDPNHINFYDGDLTENRIIGVTTITGTGGQVTNYDTPEKILKFGTENSGSTHATHVAGIMGGAFNSTGRVAYVSSSNSVLIGTSRKNPFYGVAPEAQLYPCVGDLYNANIIAAAQLFAAKCKELKRPGVFNLSVGYVPGPHDGTDEINRALAEVGKEVIVCVAAGNDGDSPITLQKDFSDGTDLKTIITPSGNSWNGVVDVWGDDLTPFTVAFALINKSNGSVVTSITVPQNIPDGYVITATKSATSYPNQVYSSTMAEQFAGGSQVSFISGVDDINSRYNIYIGLELDPASSCNVVPALIFKGAGGVKINAFTGQGLTFTNKAGDKELPGYSAGNANQSINNIACGKNIIAVGAYTTKIQWPVLSRVVMGYSNPSPIGSIAYFSSYGDVLGLGGSNEKTLPDVCAPGMGIVSSYSKYYVEKKALTDKDLCADVTTTVNTEDSKARANQWGLEQGTSMATPYVSGTVALLLEADPTLNVDRVKNLLKQSAIKQQVSGPAAIQWGAGRLNADDAMRLLLSKPSEIGNVNADSERRFAVSLTGDAVQAIVAGEHSLTATLYSLAGAQVATGRATGDTVSLSTGSIPRGVYVLTVVTPAGIKLTRTLLLQ